MHTHRGHPNRKHRISSVLLRPRTAALLARAPVARPQDSDPRCPCRRLPARPPEDPKKHSRPAAVPLHGSAAGPTATGLAGWHIGHCMNLPRLRRNPPNQRTNHGASHCIARVVREQATWGNFPRAHGARSDGVSAPLARPWPRPPPEFRRKRGLKCARPAS
eukprot:833625-Pyramimonas_sp.AAC.1